MDPQISIFSNFFIKNYFATVFFNFQFSAVSKRTPSSLWNLRLKHVINTLTKIRPYILISSISLLSLSIHHSKDMDLLLKFLNIAMPFLVLIAFPFFMPPFLLLKFLSFLKRSIYSEKVSDKVVLVTGVFSRIGKVCINVTPSNL